MKTITAFVVRIIGLCLHSPRLVILGAVVLAGVSTWYTVTHFSLNTDINQLISSNSPSRQRELAFEKAFPQFDTIIAVIDAPTPELAQGATAALAARLAQEKISSALSTSRKAAGSSPRTAFCSLRSSSSGRR